MVAPAGWPGGALEEAAVDAGLVVGAGVDHHIDEAVGAFPFVESPAEEVGVELLGAVEVVGGELEVDDAGHR